MNFTHPLWLAALMIVPILVLLHTMLQRRRRKAAVMFSDLGLVKHAVSEGKVSRRNRLILATTMMSLALLIVALADPLIPLEQTKEGVNVVLVLDVSGSMQAQDFTPNRLEAAKQSAQTLIRSLQAQDNVGLVVFSEGATTAGYLTPYKDYAIGKLEAIKASTSSTAIGDGLSLAVEMADSIPNKKRVIVLMSDGENNAGVISPTEAVAYAKDRGIQVYTIGIGSDQPAPLGYDMFGNPQYAHLDEATLKTIAQETGGEYYKAVDSNTLNRIYANIPDKIQREKEETSIKDWLIGAAAIFLIAGFALRYWRSVIQ